MTSRTGQPGYRPDIDGLRALAVAAVVAFHAFPETIRAGFIGVDVFFVISGFLITRLILREQAAGTFTFSSFYRRRIRRILPALLVVIMATWLFGWVALLPSEYAELGRHVAAAAGFASNLVLWQESGYFNGDSALKPLLHLWSLAIEEQFYLVWPLALWLCWRKRFPIAGVTLLVLALSLAICVLMREHPAAGFYLPFARVCELLVGAMVAMAMLQPSRPMGWLCWPGIGLLVLSMLLITPAMSYPGVMAMLPTIGTALLIAAGRDGWLNRVVFSRPLLVGIGLISYPLYLWHWPLFAYADILFTTPVLVALRWVLIGVALLLAAATYRYVECPLRFGTTPREGRLMGALVALGILGLATYWSGGLDARPAARYTDNRAELLRMGERNDACLRYFQPHEAPAIYCRYHDAGGATTVAVIGDSFAHVAYPGIAEVLGAHGINVLLLANPGCPAFLQAGDADDCARQTRQLVTALEGRSDIREVMIVTRGPHYIEGDAKAKTPPRFPGLTFVASLQATIDRLRAQGKSVSYVLENPQTFIQPANCIPRPLRRITQPCTLPRVAVEAQQAEYRRWVGELQHVRILDPMDAFCDADTCYLLRDGALLYADDAHVSVAGSRAMAPLLTKHLR